MVQCQFVMTDQEFTVAYLKAVERKYEAYFAKAKLCIMNSVVIKGKGPVSVHVTNEDLPDEIRRDIEMMFWSE